VLTLKKIIAEVGIPGLLRLPFILVRLLVHNFLMSIYAKDLDKLERDIIKLKNSKEKKIDSMFPFYEGGPYNYWFNDTVKKADSRHFYQNVANLIGQVGFELTDEQIEEVKKAFPVDKDDSYYRYHPLNKGKNDYWEYYLTPWHRVIPYYSHFLWDVRFREHFIPLHNKFKKWYKEFVWFLFLGTGSNIYACELGKAFHCLNEYFVEGDINALERYKRHLLKSKYFLNHAVQNGIAMEGFTYARFLIQGFCYLDGLHRYLGFEYEILDDKFLADFKKYIEMTWTKDAGFETSGDSHDETEKLAVSRPLYYLYLITKDSIYKDILEHYGNPEAYYKSFFIK